MLECLFLVTGIRQGQIIEISIITLVIIEILALSLVIFRYNHLRIVIINAIVVRTLNQTRKLQAG